MHWSLMDVLIAVVYSIAIVTNVAECSCIVATNGYWQVLLIQ